MEVAHFLAARNGFPIDFGIALWEAYVRSAHLVSRDRLSFILSYNELINDRVVVTRRLVEALQDFGVSNIAVPEEATLLDAVDNELYRQRKASAEHDDSITPSQQRLVAALAEGSTANSALFEPLSSSSRLRLEDWSRREAAIMLLRIASSEGKLAKAALKKKTEEFSASEKRLARLQSEIDERINAEPNHISNLDAEIAELKSERCQAS
jgi:hypothetical protein